MGFKKGESGNPEGRPPKSKALTDLLDKALSAAVETSDGKIAGKRLLSRLVAEAATTGKVTFPGDKTASTLGIKDWLEFVKWVYQYMEPPITRQEVTGKDGAAIDVVLKVIKGVSVDDL